MEGRLQELEGGHWELRFVRELRHPPDRVWRALVEPEQVAAWLPARMEGERRAGAELRFVFEEAPDHDSRGEMLVFEPPRQLQYSWEGDVLRFELRPLANGCELTFTSRFTEGGRAAGDAAGWHVCLDYLEAELDSTTPAYDAAERGKQLRARYRELFGPEASTIGPPDWHPEADRLE